LPEGGGAGFLTVEGDEMIRILYLGQKPIGERCFDILRDAQSSSLQISGVVSNANDDVWWKSNAIYRECVRGGIPFISNDKRNNREIENLIIRNEINAIISVQHNWILPGEILSLVNNFAFNLHNAKLPGYKGYNACNHAILNGERYYSSTVHWMAEEVDAGGIAFEESFEIGPKETAKGLYERASRAGETAFRKLVDHLAAGKPIPNVPALGAGTFYPRNSLGALREIKKIEDVQEVDRKARAFYFPPFEPAYFILDGHKFYVLPVIEYV
jgi:methionyl-tRNA formyltransferase